MASDITIFEGGRMGTAGEIPDYEAIRNIVHLYFQHTDDNDWEAWSTLVTDDFHIDINGHVTDGRDVNKMTKAETHGSKLPHGRHFASNTVIVIDGDVARATSDWMFVAEFGMPRGPKRLTVEEMGRSDDEFRRVDGKWLMSVRHIKPRFFKP